MPRDRYRIFDTNTGETLEVRPLNPTNWYEIERLFEQWPYAAIDWEIDQ